MPDCLISHLPAVSVIVPNFNHSSFLSQRLNSISYQSFQDIEIILLDDCSTDNSDLLLQNFAETEPKVSVYLRNTSNSGSPFRQWKKGLDVARGKFVWIAESDDYAKPHFLETLVTALQNNPSAHLATCASVYTNADGSLGEVIGNQALKVGRPLKDTLTFVPGRDYLWSNMQTGNGIPNASAVLARNTPLLRKSIPQSMRFCGDWVTWIRILAKHDLVLCTQIMNHWRTHPQTTRWANQPTTESPKYFWNSVQRPDYLKEMLTSMLELRPIVGRRWNTLVFQELLNHYRTIAGDTATKSFLREMGWRARNHLLLKKTIQPLWIYFKSRVNSAITNAFP